MRIRKYEEWTVERWRTEPRFGSLELDEPAISDQAPALWKDLMLASVAALLLWTAAAVMFG